MSIYLITYDLRAPGRDYATLFAELNRVGAAKLLLSVWVAELNQTAAQIRDALRTYIDGNDRLSVTEITSNWATFNGMAAGVALLKRHLP